MSTTDIRATRWRNWSRSQVATPTEIARPTGLDDVVALVQRAAESGRRVKPIGAGHSFSAVAVAPDIQVQLDAMSGLVAVDEHTGHVTLAAGTRLHQIPALLAPYGLAMQNLGDIDRQSISGALSTGTHGTGRAFGSIGSRLVAATLVTGSGDVLRVSATEHPELLPHVRLGIGALGVLVDVTIACVPAFVLRAVEGAESVDRVLERWDERTRTEDHFEWYWFPHTDRAATKVNTRLPIDTELAPLPPVRRWLDDELLSNSVFRGLCVTGTLVPSLTPAITNLSARAMGNRVMTDLSHRIFVTNRSVRFREMEYGMPLDQIPSAFREMRRAIERSGLRISFPVEVRAVAGDDATLSTARGRETGYIAVHHYWREDPRPYFDLLEPIFVAHGGRPHWGKLHTRTASDFAASIDGFDDFVAARDRLDPGRVFANPYLDRVLGS